MAKRITLILISSRHLARVDISAGKRSRILNSWQGERFDSDSIATLVNSALRLGPRKTGLVWVASSDFWSGEVPLPADVVRMLDEADLAQAIGLEAETYSGISAFDSRFGMIPMPSDSADKKWRVVQVPRMEIEEIKQTVSQFGGRFGGLGHPAVSAPGICDPGFRQSTEGSQLGSQPWRTIQCFGEQVLALHGRGDELLSSFTSGNLRTPRTQSLIRNWIGTPSNGELPDPVWLSDVPLPAELDEEVSNPILVTERQGLERWALGWVTALVQNPSAVTAPVIVAEKQPMSRNQAMAISAVIGLIGLVGCVGFHQFNQWRLRELVAQVKTLEANDPKQAAADVKRETASVNKQIAADQQELTKLDSANSQLRLQLESAAAQLRVQQTRWLQVVNALAAASSDRCWIRQIDGSGGRATFQGVALKTVDASRFASKLEESIGDGSWHVQPPQMDVQPSGLVEFTISLIPIEAELPSRIPTTATITSADRAELD